MLEEKEGRPLKNIDSKQKSVTAEPSIYSEKTTENISTNQPKAEAVKSDTNTTISKEATSSNKEDLLNKIEETNAEDTEDKNNHSRHIISVLDYSAMSMENLVGELQRLVKNKKIQTVKKDIDGIKHEFDLKFREFSDHKKEEFINKGGNEIDFRYNSTIKLQFNDVYSDYREKYNQYCKNLEQSLKDNLQKRLQLIENLKGLINVEEDINTTYKSFKNIQEKWRKTGPVPRASYNDVWRTYHHHIEIFYDFLHLNRELRDLDFKHNLEEKIKIVKRTEALANEENLNKAFQELQILHKIWKEDIGPVGKEHREEIWERFSNATKVLHHRRQLYYKEQDKVYEQNLIHKNNIIAAINELVSKVSDNHKTFQQQIKELEQLRDSFFKAGKVPQKVNEKTWASFKEAVRSFNRSKKVYYKNLKKEQQDNLDKKKTLLALAISLKDSDEWNSTTSEMKRIQSDWKKIGHVPRKYSDKIWNEFKNACNHYFDRLHALKNESNKEEITNLKKKNSCLEKLKKFEPSGDKTKDLSVVKEFVSEWKSYGRVPYSKKNINGKFDRILDLIFKKLDVSEKESELFKYANKTQELVRLNNKKALYNERVFIRHKIEESKNEIRQLENNIQFFSNTSEDSYLVKEVVKNVDNHKKALDMWKAKLKKLDSIENELNKKA